MAPRRRGRRWGGGKIAPVDTAARHPVGVPHEVAVLRDVDALTATSASCPMLLAQGVVSTMRLGSPADPMVETECWPPAQPLPSSPSPPPHPGFGDARLDRRASRPATDEVACSHGPVASILGRT